MKGATINSAEIRIRPHALCVCDDSQMYVSPTRSLVPNFEPRISAVWYPLRGRKRETRQQPRTPRIRMRARRPAIPHKLRALRGACLKSGYKGIKGQSAGAQSSPG